MNRINRREIAQSIRREFIDHLKAVRTVGKIYISVTARRIEGRKGSVGTNVTAVKVYPSPVVTKHPLSVVRTFGTTCGVDERSAGLVWD